MRHRPTAPLLRACALLLLGLCMHISLPGQIVVNVKVRSEAAELSTWLRQYSTAGRPDPAASFRSAWPWVNQIQQVTPLAPLSRMQKRPGPERLFTLAFPGTDTAALLASLRASGQFEFAEPVRTVQLTAFVPATPPTDPAIADQWYHSKIQTFEAWDITRGSSSIRIGVLDTGLDYGHPEFEGQVWINAAEDLNGDGRFQPWADTTVQGGITGDFDGLDNDGNGYADDVIGYDFTDQPRNPVGGDYLFPDPDPQDDNTHGTLVAGILGAKADNEHGGAGIAPGCRIVPIRCFGANGSGEDDDIARAIIYAADNGIPVLNFSFGDIYPSLTMHEAIRYAAARGCVMIGSAGNATGDNVHYPSNFDEVIAVSATDISFDGSREILWPFSSYGLTVSLAAPGSNIYAPKLRDDTGIDYDYFSGTSCSAPMVSAAVALLFSQRGICSAQQVRGILTATADDVGDEGWDHYTGAGRLNLRRALESIYTNHVQFTTPENDAGTAGPTLPVAVTVLHPLFASWSLEYMPGTEDNSIWIPLLEDQTAQVNGDTVLTWNVAGMQEGAFTLRLRVDLQNGTTSEDRIRIVIDRSAPVVDLKLAAPAWDNESRKMLILYRSSDPGLCRLHYRSLPAGAWEEIPYDRLTRSGEFLLGPDRLSPGTWECYVSATNAAGLQAVSARDTFTYTPGYLAWDGFDTLAYHLPMGHYMEATQDFDGDGLREIVMSRYTDNLGFGRLVQYEFNGAGFTALDSITVKPVLIPKDVADTDGDGLPELLASVNDSICLFEAAGAGSFPKQVQYQDFGNGYYAAGFGDTDGEGQPDMLVKDLKDYYVREGSGTAWIQTAKLEDSSPGYEGSVAPRPAVGDFDGDGLMETAYGDYDGDLLVYEYDGSAYALRLLDTTALERAGTWLTAGDYDGDGRDELFVATHPTTLRNDDYEYESPYWVLRILKATANDTWTTVWRDHLYDFDQETFNAATALNCDSDPAEELLFTTFPRTYLLEYTGTTWEFTWFHYGDLCTHHVAGDFNGNGVQEFALGNGLDAQFWEKTFTYTGPAAVPYLEGTVLDSQRVRIDWAAVPNATAYRIWRGLYTGSGSVSISLVDSVSATTYTDAGLTEEARYLYVLQAKNPALTPAIGPFGYAILLQPHDPVRLDSVHALTATQLEAFFSEPMQVRAEDEGGYTVNSSTHPIALNPAASRVLLSLPQPLSPGAHTLSLSSALRDARAGMPDPAFSSAAFTWTPQDSAIVYLTRWQALNDTEAQLWYNEEVTATALDLAHYALHPYGTLVDLRWADASHTSVIVRSEKTAFASLGYAVSIVVTGVQGVSGNRTSDKEGNVATFTGFEEDLSGVYVYPNPWQAHDLFDGVRFANLSQTCTVTILSVAGRKVQVLEETDGDGGIIWDLHDSGGERVKPGIYLYKIESPGLESVMGQFTILDR